MTMGRRRRPRRRYAIPRTATDVPPQDNNILWYITYTIIAIVSYTVFGHCDDGDSYCKVTATINGDWSPLFLHNTYLSYSIKEYYISLTRVTSSVAW